MDFDFTTKAGIQKFLVTIFGLIIEVVAILMPQDVDTITKLGTMIIPILAVIAYYIVNQVAATGKAKTAQAELVTKTETIKTLAITAPEVAIALASPIILPQIAAPIPQVKDKIKVARQTYGTWEGAKAMLLGTFKDRFESALRRFASIGDTPIEVARKAVDEVAGVYIDDKACELISQTPGFLGAVSSKVDIQIIGDLIAAVEKTPALAYVKTALINRAVWYAVKGVVDDAVVRLQAGEGNAESKLVLQEFGVSAESARKSQWSGRDVEVYTPMSSNPADGFQFKRFNQWALAGIDPTTMNDL